MRYYRKVIKIRAVDSPNVRHALDWIAAGLEPTGEVIVPGVLTWEEYKKRRQTWDKVKQTIGLDAEFYEGAGVLLYPPDRLDASQARAREFASGRYKRQGKALGVDSGEGSANNSWVVVDDLGVIAIRSRKTTNTATITGDTIAIGREFGVPPDKWFFDAGGGGKQHVDRLRDQGYPAQTVAFGSPVAPEIKRVQRQVSERKEAAEERYVYVNRRAQMYHKAALLLEDDPPFAVDFDANEAAQEVRRQMAVVPKVLGAWSMYDVEGRIRMLPKTKRNPDSSEVTLTDLIGHSPDELDALVLAVHGMTHRSARAMAGAAY